MKGWPIAVAAFSAVFLFGGVAGAKPAPVRIGVVLNALDNPFFVTIYEGAITGEFGPDASPEQLGIGMTGGRADREAS